MRRYKVIDTDCEADVWFDNVENKPLDYKDIEKILEKQDTKWQKLERWLTDKHNNDNDNSLLYTEILIKMQKLEGEDENTRK